MADEGAVSEGVIEEGGPGGGDESDDGVPATSAMQAASAGTLDSRSLGGPLLPPIVPTAQKTVRVPIGPMASITLNFGYSCVYGTLSVAKSRKVLSR